VPTYTATTRQLETTALAAHRRGIGWSTFWAIHGLAVAVPEPEPTTPPVARFSPGRTLLAGLGNNR